MTTNENLQQAIGRGQQAHIDLVNDLATFKVKNRAEHAIVESNINFLTIENKKLKEDMEEVIIDRNAMALVVDNFEEKVERIRPKKSIWTLWK